MKQLPRGIIIRRFLHSDLSQIKSLTCEKFRCPDFTGENIAELFYSGREYSLALVRKNKLLGFLIAEKIENMQEEQVLNIRWFFINPPLQGKNLEREMLLHLLEKKKNFKILVDIDEENAKMIKLFKNQGFEKKSGKIRLALDMKNTITGNEHVQ